MKILLLLLASTGSFAADRTVDLQFALCEPYSERLAEKLGFEKDPKKLVVSYFDDSSASLTRAGVFLKIKEEEVEVVSEVKVVYAPFQVLPKGVQCEVDRYGPKREKKCSLENESEEKPRWTMAQKAFAESKGKIDWSALRAIGPFLEYRWKGEWDETEASLDVLVVPGGEPITELSVKVDLEDEEEHYREIISRLSRKRIELCPRQEGKIQRLLRSSR